MHFKVEEGKDADGALALIGFIILEEKPRVGRESEGRWGEAENPESGCSVLWL